MKSTGLQRGLRLVRRHPRAAARVGRYAARHPRRAATVIRLAREAPSAARLLAAGYALAQVPPKRRSRRGRLALVSLGAIGGAAYAAYRITRGRDAGPPSGW